MCILYMQACMRSMYVCVGPHMRVHLYVMAVCVGLHMRVHLYVMAVRVPELRCKERVSAEQGSGLSVVQVGGGLSIYGYNAVTNTQTPILTDGAPIHH